ncbi:uncharacterized protein LOC142231460 [Haematobia irritans]|uniref:uncharacterized protein LOC142231460 n=1 Tax=Haematobia irritans TaxID=7368 RepID=UPI003F508BF4
MTFLEEIRTLKSEITKLIIDMAENNKKLITSLTEEVVTLRNEIRHLKKQNLFYNSDENSLLTRTPFKTVVDLKGFDSELRTNPDLVSELKEICLRFGGEDLPGFLRKSFKAIVSDELAMQFSWRGTKEKENMQNLKVISVLRDLSHHKFPNTDDGKITHILQQYIVHAKDRFERRQK